MTRFDASLPASLTRLAELLERIEHPRAAEVHALGAELRDSPQQALARLDDNDWWAGAGSLAAETMADHPALPGQRWQQEVREFRALMIEIGEALRAQGAHNPGIDSWLLAFHNWNASEV
ncbi:MAG: hypothetical protein VBE63_20500 [Lamprobacter sp.]|uniref:hypothetical protein n=1 Tax=Lamprobacter sp. TaxID=3100796 RepID=UPI002B25BA6A|nr:hypothetical protein [Lamprobacter sp.]MEA3642300.1 hypothetical protein [Lamprobacter sp.]